MDETTQDLLKKLETSPLDKGIIYQTWKVLQHIDRLNIGLADFRIDNHSDLQLHIPRIGDRVRLAECLTKEVGPDRAPGDGNTWEILLNSLVCIYDTETYNKEKS